jgi:predicted PurR-regulated permease PerM
MSETPAADVALERAAADIVEPAPPIHVILDQRTIMRVGWVLVFVVACAALGRWIMQDAGALIFTLTMSLIASIAMEPAVSKLARHMKRGFATIVVMLAVIVGSILFIAMFGKLLAGQLADFIKSVPALVNSLVTWLNHNFGMKLDPNNVLDAINLTPDQIRQLSTELAGGLLGVVVSVLSAFFSTFTLGLFTFYFSADAPRLRRWIARLFPPRQQAVVVTVWELAVQKTGGYVAARVVLAGICGSITAVFFLIIGMPYWLLLGVWTGVVAQFVPTIGTYIAIALPVFIGLTSPEPFKGVLALIFALIYQQIENLTIEPQISAKAVDLHPAVSFAAVMLGASLFGVAGALVGVPMAALILSLFEIYSHKYDVAEAAAVAVVDPATSQG